MWALSPGAHRVAKDGVRALQRKNVRRLLSTAAKKQGYQSIGSFHSDNLADLMALSDAEYIPPTLPFADDFCPNDSDFLLDLDQFTFLNHGAFGAALNVGFHRAAAWRLHLERQPLRYFDRDLLPHLVYSTRLLADFVQAPRQDVVLAVNATTAMNNVLAGYAHEFKSASHVILWDTSYGSVKKMARHHVGAQNVTEIPLQERYLDQLAASNQPEQVLQQALDDTWQASNLTGKRPLLILDHTSSNTALTFPINLLAKQAKEYHPSPLVLVDGAHGLLAQDVSLSQLQPHVDFYVTNGHKWLGAVRGVAMLYAAPAWHSTILRRPVVISHGVDEPDLFSRFVWDGTRDHAAALSLPVVLEHWKQRDPAAVRTQLKDTLRLGIQALAEAWHPDCRLIKDWPGQVTLAKFDDCDMLSPMALVRLPGHEQSGEIKTSTDSKHVQDYLYSQGIEVPIKCIQGKLYVRVSCHVYNNVRDFEILAEAIQRYGKLQ